jgi:hypothetical protein
MKKNILHQSDAVIYYRTMYAGEEYLAEEPLTLPLPTGSRSPCHL